MAGPNERSHEEQQAPTPFDYYRRLQRVRSLVVGDLQRNVSRDEAAGVAGMEPAAFSRFFKQQVGVTFVEWKAIARVAKAIDLIERRNLPLRRVARLAGFPQSRSFRRHFKRVTGVTPREYREQFRNRLRAGGPEVLQRHLGHLALEYSLPREGRLDTPSR